MTTTGAQAGDSAAPQPTSAPAGSAPAAGSPSAPAAADAPAGVESPVFWGSLAGLLASAVFAALSYAKMLTPPATTQPVHFKIIITLFLCIAGVRYYTSLVFLSFDDAGSKTVAHLSKRKRRVLFAAQTFQILGTSLNLALLTSVGAWASGVVVILQAASTGLYWVWLWSQAKQVFRTVMVAGEVAILALAVLIVLRETGTIGAGEHGELAVVGAFGLAFFVEITESYWRSIKRFVAKTAKQLA